MKRIITIIAALLIGFSASAQTAARTSANVAKAIDTISTSSSADTVDMYSPLDYFISNDGCWGVGTIATKISGTASANCLLQTTIDGTNWKDLYGTSADTAAIANTSGAQIKHWYVTGTKPTRARVRILAPSSTQAVQVKTYWRK